MTLPYSFGAGTTADQNFFKQLQADFVAAEAQITAAIVALAPQLAKAWASVTVSGTTPTLQAGHNVTSVAFVSTGRYTITIATDFSSANWVPLVMGGEITSTRAYGSVVAIAAGSVTILLSDVAGNLINPTSFYFAGFGTQ